MSLVPTETTGEVVRIDQAGVLRALNLDPANPKTQALLLVCDKYGLDPVLKHMVLIQGTPYITRDGLLANAHNSGVFDGIEVLEQGETDTHFTAKVAVYRKDMGRPIAYTGRYPKNGGNREYAPEMAVKCAEVAALRRAFNITGIATREEQWDLVDVDGFDRAPLATDDQVEQIRRLAAHLDDGQRAEMAQFREEQGISMKAGEFTAEHADLVIVALEELLDDDDGGPDGGGGTPVPVPDASGPDGPGVAPDGGEAEVAGREPGVSSTDGGAVVDPAAPSDTPQDVGPLVHNVLEASGTASGSTEGGEGDVNATAEAASGSEVSVPDADPAPSTDVQDLVDLVKEVPGYKQQGPREAKLLKHARTAAATIGVEPPSMFSDLAPGPLLDATFELVEAIVSESSGTSQGAGGSAAPSDGVPPPSGGEPASREATQQALIMRIQDGVKSSRERQDAARHALIRHVTDGRTESSKEASKDELLAAHRILDECEAGTMELHLRANGSYLVRERRGAAA